MDVCTNVTVRTVTYNGYDTFVTMSNTAYMFVYSDCCSATATVSISYFFRDGAGPV